MKTAISTIITSLFLSACACNCGCIDDYRSQIEWPTPTPTDNSSETGAGEPENSDETETCESDWSGETGGAFDITGDIGTSCPGFCPIPLCQEGISAKYEAVDSVTDQSVSQLKGGFGIFAPHFFCDNSEALFTFNAPDGDVELVVLDTGDAWLGGTAVVISDGCTSIHDGELWDIDIDLDVPITAVQPRRELDDPNVNQPATVTNTWQYWLIDDQNAHITSQFGTDAQLTKKPFDGSFGFQVGNTASGKNLDLGASTQFYFDMLDANNVTRIGQGDISIDLHLICSRIQ